MSDIKDILGVSRPDGADGGEKPAKPEKPKKEKVKRPEGMSREAFALLGGSHPIASSQLLSSMTGVGQKAKGPDIMAKPKPSTKGIPTWQYKRFKNSARGDGLELLRWAKGFKDVSGRIRDEEDTDYFFAKFNKQNQLYRYTPEEYEDLIEADSGDWSREETDHLMDLCQQLDLRFTIIADRFESKGSSTRAVEDLKERYYAIARKLVQSRGSDAGGGSTGLMRNPFNKASEVERKQAVHVLLTRTEQQIEEDNAVVAEARVIEERRKSDAAAAAASTAPSPYSDAGDGGGAGFGASPSPLYARAPAAGPLPLGSAQDFRHPQAFPNAPGPGVPSLFDSNVNPAKPPRPGSYFREVCTTATAAAMTASTSARVLKALEQTLLDVGFGPRGLPQVHTRAVAGAWLALQSEIIALHETKLAQGVGPGSEERKKGNKRMRGP